MTLPPADEENGLTGYFITRTRGAYQWTLPWTQVVAPKRRERKAVANFEPRPDSAQYLTEWNEDDYRRLDLNPLQLVSGAGDEDELARPKRKSLRAVRGR